MVQLAVSGLVGMVLVGLAAWAKIARPGAPLDEARARAILKLEFPGRVVDALWVGVNGSGALARSGGAALVLCKSGEGFVARQIPWAQAVSASFRNGELRINLADVAQPAAVIRLPAWPPKDLAA
jgi:hypothetical protein